MVIASGCGWSIRAGMGHHIIPDIWVIVCNKDVEIDREVKLINVQQIFLNPGLDIMKGTETAWHMCCRVCRGMHLRPFNHSLVRPTVWQRVLHSDRITAEPSAVWSIGFIILRGWKKKKKTRHGING